MADHDRLDEAADELIAENEQAEDGERCVPVRKNGESEKRRRGRAEHRADVRNETQQAREHAPERGVRNLQEPESEPDQDAEAEVQQGDGQEVATDALG